MAVCVVGRAWTSLKFSRSWIRCFSHPAAPSLCDSWTLNEFGGWHVEWDQEIWLRENLEWFKRVNTTGFHFKFGLTSHMRKSRVAESQQQHSQNSSGQPVKSLLYWDVVWTGAVSSVHGSNTVTMKYFVHACDIYYDSSLGEVVAWISFCSHTRAWVKLFWHTYLSSLWLNSDCFQMMACSAYWFVGSRRSAAVNNSGKVGTGVKQFQSTAPARLLH